MRDIKIGFARVVGILLTISLFLLSVVSLSSSSDTRSSSKKEVRTGITDKGITLPHPPTNSPALPKRGNLGDYNIPWDVIDAGGGFATSSGSGYKLGGSLDQTAIGVSHSDSYKVCAGYWCEVVDLMAPGVISDLDTSSVTDNSVTLIWTAPGDDGTMGRADLYDIRFHTAAVESDTTVWWDTAYTVANAPDPSSAGERDSCIVMGLTTGKTYYFAVKTADEVPNWSGISNIAPGTPTGVKEQNVLDLPKTFSLSQNYPNPFNPSTQIKYDLPKNCYIKLDVYNLLGQKVATLVEGKKRAGYKTVSWNGKGVASGIYFFRLQAGSFVQTRKMVLLK